jgi:hypothetical protein
VYQYVSPSTWVERTFGTSLSSTKFTQYSHKTADYTISYADNGTFFTNLGATDLITLTLPAATGDGYTFSFFVDGYTGIEIAKSEPTDVIFIDGWINDDSAGKVWTSYTPGDYVTLTAWDGFTWNAISSSGIAPNSVTNDLLRDSAGLSVMGRSANTTGDPADIVADTDNTVLRRSGTSIGFGTIPQSAVTNLTTDLAAKLPTIASSTDLSIARWDGTGGNLLQGSAVTISDLGEIAGGRSPTVSYTSNQTLIASQSGTIFTNKDATGQVDLTLPVPAAGLEYYFHVDTAQLLRIKPNISGANYLMVDGYLTVDYFESNTVGDFLYLYAIDSNGWQGFSDGTLNGNKVDITVSDYQRQWIINDEAVTFAKMQHSSAAGLSVVGRSTNSAGDFSEIIAGSDNTYLRRNGTTIEFGALPADAVTSVFSRTGAVIAATNDYTWAQIDKTTSSLADITTRSHTALTDIGTNSHATIDSHIASTSNPHSVTASQVGNGTAQWNADKLRGVNIDATTPTTNQVLQYNGTDWAPATFSGGLSSTLNSANIFVGNGSNIATGVAVSGDISIDNAGLTAISSGVIVNADINASAGIAVSKLAAITANRALVSDGSGVISVHGTVSDTELGYLDGVTSAIQTQIDLKENLAITVEAKTANYSVLASDNKRVFTNASNPSVDVTFTLPSCAAGLSYTFIKDCDKVFTITAAANDAIVYHQQSTALAGSIVLDNVGDSVILVAGDDDLWYAQPFDEKIRLAENKIFIGSTLGFAEGQTMSGDVTLSVSGTAVIGANAVLLGKIAQSTVGTCLIGRSAATTGDFGEIAATENGQSLYRTGGILAFSHGVGQGTNTSDADCVVDANLYDAFSWVFTSSAGTGRNLQIDNLVAGRKVRIFVKNDSGSNAATISLIASTTTSGHSNVVLAGGAVNTFSAAINGVYKQIEIINISGTFFATVVG